MAGVNNHESAEFLAKCIDIGVAMCTAQTEEKIHYLTIPEGHELQSLKDLQYPFGVPPERIIATVQLRDAASFCRYYSLFADERSRIFAEPDKQSFAAILDYHGVGAGDVRKPEFLSHKALFQMVLDERWKTWAAKSEKQFNQVDFAEFIEDQATDILDPPGAAVLEVARDLKASISGSFESKVVPKNGSVALRYSETVNGKVGSGSIDVPEFFTLSIPVFYGEEPVTVSARLRYRIAGGQLTFTYKLYRTAWLVDQAFQRAAASISDTLKCDVLMGCAG